jgi:hypothetical protein
MLYLPFSLLSGGIQVPVQGDSLLFKKSYAEHPAVKLPGEFS